jgi:hypothetical protein
MGAVDNHNQVIGTARTINLFDLRGLGLQPLYDSHHLMAMLRCMESVMTGAHLMTQSLNFPGPSQGLFCATQPLGWRRSRSLSWNAG